MQEAAPATAAAGAAPPPKPFLRRGAGWEARVAAAREGRRYVPRGGAIKDYSQEGEASLPPRRRTAGSKPPRSPVKAGGGARKAGGPTHPVQAAAVARQKPAAARAGRSAPPSAAASPARPHAAERAPPSAAPAAATAGWARRLLQQQGAPQSAAVASAGAVAVNSAGAVEAPQSWARQAAALQEFEALESQVLREVQTNSPAPHGSGGKRVPGSRGDALRPQPAAGGSAQQRAPPAATEAGLEPENWAAAQQQDEDVFASDGEGGVYGLFGEGSQAQAAAAGVAHPLACRGTTFGGSSLCPAQAAGAPAAAQRRGPPPVYNEEGDEGELHAESSFQDVPHHPASSLVQRFLSRPAPAAGPQEAARPAQQRDATGSAALPGDPRHASAAEAEALEQLQQEVVALQQERARVARMRLELEEAAGRLEQDKAAFEKRKVEEAACFEAERAEELRKLQRDRRVLEKQSRAIMKMPTKQSKEEVAAVEALLAEERRAARAREARHKLSVERLRQQLVELQSKNSELREQVLCLEQQRLAAAWGEVAAGPAAAPAASAAAAAAAATAVPRPSHGLAAAGQKAGGSAAPSQLPAAGHVGRLSGLPAVRVERGSGSTSSARFVAGAAAGLHSGLQREDQHSRGQPPSWTTAPVHGAGAEGGGAALDEAIADVELCGAEDVLVWSEEQPAGMEELNLSGEQAAHGLVRAAGAAAVAPGLGASAYAAASGSVEVRQSWLPGASAAGNSPPAPPAAAAGDAMSRASSALARFNQLRSSLAQHGSLQGSLPSSNPAPFTCPPSAPSAVATPQPMDGVAMAPSAAAHSCGPPSSAAQQDDLRRLGRSLLAAGAPAGAPASGSPDALPPASSAHPPLAASFGVAAAPAGGAGADAVVLEVQQPDGRWERLLASGAWEQRFANGSAKRSLPSGASLTRFANGDVKKVLPGGTVEYYFAEVDSWQVTHPSGVDVFYFPSGQVEAHRPGGVKEVLFPDGAVRKLLPDGRELAISAAHLSREIQAAQPVAALE